MVRLKARQRRKPRPLHRYFNSYMVRLKAFKEQRQDEEVAVFQFLYGAIKREETGQFGTTLFIFQFLYGAIKRMPEIKFITWLV